MSDRNTGLTADPLFVGITRPPMRWGVAYEALLLNLVITMEVFVMTKNLLTLLLAIPIHGVCAVLCARDARFFHLMLLWARTRLLAYFGTVHLWQAASYSPLALDLPDIQGRRKAVVITRVCIGDRGAHRCGR
jgi:type IV secretion system protein VirB3